MGSGDKRQSLLSNTQIWEEICNILPAAFVKGVRQMAATEHRNAPVLAQWARQAISAYLHFCWLG